MTNFTVVMVDRKFYFFIYFKEHEKLKCVIVFTQYKFPGAYSCKVTPVPIPNTVVKLATPMILTRYGLGKQVVPGLN